MFKNSDSYDGDLVRYVNNILEQKTKADIITEISTNVRSSLSLEKVIDSILIEIRSLIDIERSGIFLFDKETDSIKIDFKGGSNCETKAIFLNQLSKSAIYYLFEKNRQYVDTTVSNFFSDKEIVERINSKICIKTFVITPICYKDELIGIIATYGAKPILKSQLDLLLNISSQTGVAIFQAQQYEYLKLKNKEEKHLCEKAQKHNELKSELLTNMSHELKSPLTAIIGNADFLGGKDGENLTNTQKSKVKAISISAKYLLKLINQLLDISKIESGRFEIDYEFFNSKSIIYEAMAVLEELAARKNIEIKSELEDVCVNADKVRFSEVIFNLLSNAIKFSKENGIIIIKSQNQDENLYVEVQDNGIGIPDSQKENLFNRFVSYAEKSEGTGLGLYLTKNLVEIHGGKIDFESQSDVGSKFWFIIPKKKVCSLTSEKIVG